MPTKSPDGIYYADGTTPASLSNITDAMATSIQNAFNVREQKNYVWPDEAAREAQTSPGNGEIGYQTDNATFYIYSGSWLIWAKAPTAYTPTFTNFSTTDFSFVYSISGGVVFITGMAISTGAVSGSITFTLPSGYEINAAYVDGNRGASLGTGGVDDSSTASFFKLEPTSSTSASIALAAMDVSTNVRLIATSATVPLTWASGDKLYVNFSYPVA